MIEHEPDPLRRIPTKHALEVHAEIGAVLRAARTKRGQSIESVSQQTRIPKRYLEALENDRFDEFPAFVYMRGFLKGYCDHLDVAFDELWSKVQPTAEAAPSTGAGSPTPPSDSSAPSAHAPTAAHAPAHPPAPSAAPHGHAPAAAPHAPHESSSATGAILFALALAVGLGVWMYNGRNSAPATSAESTPRALLPLPRAVEPNVVLKATDDAWVRVAVDGGVVFEGRLPRGAEMEWRPAHGVALRTTAPGALRLTVNGNAQPLDKPTPDGEYRIDLP